MKKIFALTLILIFALSNFCFAEMNLDITDKVKQHDSEGGYLQEWVDDGEDLLNDKFPLLGGGDSTTFYIDPENCSCTSDGDKIFVSATVHNIAGGVNEDGTPEIYRVFEFKFESFIDADGDRKIFLKDILIKSDNTAGLFDISAEDIVNEILEYDDGLIFHIFQRAIGIVNLAD